MPHVLRWLIGLATSLIGNHIYLVTLAWVAVQTTTPANVAAIAAPCPSVSRSPRKITIRTTASAE